MAKGDTDSSALHKQAQADPQRPRTGNRTLLEDNHASHHFIADLASGKSEADPMLPQATSLPRSPNGSKLITAAVVFAWFCSNIALLLMNKYLLSNYGFKQPVFLTLCHMLACVILSMAFSTTQYVPKKSVSSNGQLIKISLLAVVFAMSVVLGNVSLRFIPVSFSQVRPFLSQCTPGSDAGHLLLR